MAKLNTLQDRFKVLYAAEGRDLRECYEALKAEGFQTGQWMSFKGRFYKFDDRKELEKQHLISKSIRESIEDIQWSILKMALDIFLRLRLQYEEKKTLSIEEIKDFIRLAGEVLALSPKHPKYSLTQRNLNVNADFSGNSLVEVFYRSINKVPEVRRVFEDPAINEKFLNEIQKMTVQVQKGKLLLDAAPEAARGEAIDA